MSRLISDLLPWFQIKVNKFLHDASEQNLPILITRTLTTNEIQNALYSIGRRPLREDEIALLKTEGLLYSSQSKPVTNAPNAQSTSHGVGLGFDCIPLGAKNQPWWDAPDTIWKKLYNIAIVCGIDPYGDPAGAYMPSDKGHFEEPGWKLFVGH